MKHTSKTPHVGAIMTLPILKTVVVKGKSQYVVLYEDRQLRVSQLETDSADMKEVKCKIASVNLFNVPTLERYEAVSEVVQEKPKSDVSKSKLLYIDASTTVGDIFASRASEKQEVIREAFIDTRKPSSPKSVSYIERDSPSPVSERPARLVAYESSARVETSVARIREVPMVQQRKSGVSKAVEQTVVFYSDSTLEAYFCNEESSNFKRWFISTGGIRRRYDILYLLARQLLDIHRKNMACGLVDASDVKISFHNGTLNVAILREAKLMTGLSSHKGISPLLPPEVNLCRMPISPLSDSFTFALLVHQLLCFCHPFEGDIVLDGGKEYLVQSLTGKLPWIEHSEDSVNRRTQKFFDGFFVTDEVWQLLQKTFEQGLHDPISRPTMYEWCDALEHAYDGLAYCDKCQTHYLYEKEGCCTLCDEGPEKIVTLEIRRWFCAPQWDEEDQSLVDKFCMESTIVAKRYLQNNGRKLQIWTNHLMIPVVKNQLLFDLELASESLHQKKLIVRPHGNTSIYVMSGNGQVYQKPITSEQTFIVNELTQREFVLAVKPFDVEQRVVIIK